MPAIARIVERAPSAAARRRAPITVPSLSSATARSPSWLTPTTPEASSVTPSAFAFSASVATRKRFSIIWANGSPGSTSPAKVRNTGRMASSSRLSVTTMSRIGCACPLTASQTPSVSNSRRAAATMAEARSSSAWLTPSAGSATVTANDGPSAWRNATASVRPVKPPPAISTSTFSRVMVPFYHAWTGLDPALEPVCKGKRNNRTAHGLRRSGSPRHSRSRAAGGEPVPRPLAAVALAAGVRRPGDRPGAGRRLPHRRGRRRAAAAFAARLFPARRRSQSADHLRGRPHPRRQEFHHPQRQGDPARPRHLLHVGVVPPLRAGPDPSGQDARGAEAGRAAERRGAQGPHLSAVARTGAALLRARAADRIPPRGVQPLSRRKIGERPLRHLDPRHRPAARRAGDPSMRARLRLRHDAARRGADPARPQRVLRRHHGGEPRPRAVVPPPIPRRRMAALRPGQPEPRRLARLFARLDLRARRHTGRFGRPGRPAAAAPARQNLNLQDLNLQDMSFAARRSVAIVRENEECSRGNGCEHTAAAHEAEAAGPYRQRLHGH